MKKLFTVGVLCLALMISMVSVALAATVPDGVGTIREDGWPQDWDASKKQTVTDAFIAEYKAQADAGFNLGTPNGGDQVHAWDGPVSQNFTGGDSTSNAWGINTLAIIFVNAPGERAYTVKNEILNAFQTIGAPAACGGPLSNEFINKDGNLCQNFKNGAFVKVNGTVEWKGGEAFEEPAAPAEEKPAEEKPAEEKPAEEKPADEKPADNNPATGDAGMMIYIAMAGVSGLAMFKRK